MPTKRTTTVFLCNVCKLDYSTRAEAEECESLPLEQKVHGVGDWVKVTLGTFKCHRCGFFRPKGEIIDVRVVGGDESTHNYIRWWLSETPLSTLLGTMHLYRYLVRHRCKCGRLETAFFFAIQLTRCKKPAPKATSTTD